MTTATPPEDLEAKAARILAGIGEPWCLLCEDGSCGNCVPTYSDGERPCSVDRERAAVLAAALQAVDRTAEQRGRDGERERWERALKPISTAPGLYLVEPDEMEDPDGR